MSMHACTLPIFGSFHVTFHSKSHTLIAKYETINYFGGEAEHFGGEASPPPPAW